MDECNLYLLITPLVERLARRVLPRDCLYPRILIEYDAALPGSGVRIARMVAKEYDHYLFCKKVKPIKCIK